MRRRAATIWTYGIVLLRHRALMLGIPAVAAAVAAALSLSAPREYVAPAPFVSQSTRYRALGDSPTFPTLIGYLGRQGLDSSAAAISGVREVRRTIDVRDERSRGTLRTAALAGILAVFFAAALSFLLEYLRLARADSAEAYRELALLRPMLRARGLG